MNKTTNFVQNDPFAITFDNLPETLPIFPLPGAMLLPHGRMPLNIFEPRYLDMVFDSLKKGRLIGMVQPTEVLRDPLPDQAELFKVGCAGRVVAFAEIDDGRVLITLKGICRFKIEKELNSKSAYRKICPDFSFFEDDLSLDYTGIDRSGLIKTMRQYVEYKGLQVDWDGLEKTEDHLLIASLAMTNPFNFKEKQAILESRSTSDIVNTMMALMQIEVSAKSTPVTQH